MPVDWAFTAGPVPPPLRAPVVVDASSVVVVEGSVTIVGPGRAVVVLDDFPTTIPRSEREPEQPAVTRASATAMPATPVLLMADRLLMGRGRPFQNGSNCSIAVHIGADA